MVPTEIVGRVSLLPHETPEAVRLRQPASPPKTRAGWLPGQGRQVERDDTATRHGAERPAISERRIARSHVATPSRDQPRFRR